MKKLFKIYFVASLTFILLVTPINAKSFETVFQWIARFQSGEDLGIKVLFNNKSFTVYQGKRSKISNKAYKRLIYPPIRQGAEGPEVLRIQTALQSQGFYTGELDGKYGQIAAESLKSFQRSKNLKADGTVGPQTWEALFPGKKLRSNLPKSPTIAYTKKGLEFIYTISEQVEVETVLVKGKEVSWKKRQFKPIGTYSLKEWPVFINQAVPKGLLSYEILEIGNRQYLNLVFKRKGVPKYQIGEKAINFTEKFYTCMKISNQHGYRSSNSKKVVILVHEPHWSVKQQFQLVEGLGALVDDNPGFKYRFLIEGDLADTGRNISALPLDSILSRDPKIRKVQVHQLLRDFLIDGPLAYRLLYNPNLPAFAIDDPEQLRMSPRRARLHSKLEVLNVLQSTVNKLDAKSGQVTDIAKRMLDTMYSLLIIDISDLTGEIYLNFLNDRSELNKHLAQALELISAGDFADEINFFNEEHRRLGLEVETYRHALERDKTMAHFIRQHFSSLYAKRIPIAFIGSFHTSGIIKRLPQDIGYIVIEPQVYDRPSESELEAFNDALHNYDDVLRKKAIEIRKLRVAPEKKHIPLINRYVERIAKRTGGKADIINSEVVHRPAREKILGSIQSNGSLNEAVIEFAGGGSNSPPPPFTNAFASFAIGPKGEKPRMILFPEKGREWKGAEEQNWTKPDRLDFLKNVLLIPLKSSRDAKFSEKSRKVTFYQDYNTKRIYFTSYDVKTQTYYLFESKEAMKGSEILALPRVEKEQSIHMMLSILDLCRRGKAA